MSTEIKMPQMGESIAEGTLTRWFKKPGEAVKRDEPLFEISTDKVDAEIPSPGDGVLEKIMVEEGTTVEVNTVVAILGQGNAAGAAAPTKKETQDSAPAKPASPPAAARAPAASTSAPPPAPARPATAGASTNHGGSSGSAAASDQAVRSSPLVRRIAREHGVADLSRVPASGLGGRVTKHDILAFVDSGNTGSGSAGTPAAASSGAPSRPAASAAPAGHASALPVLNLPRTNVRVERMTVMRKKIAEHMVESRRISAHVQSVFEADMTQIVKLRDRSKGQFESRHGVKLTFTPFFMKATVSALLEFPHLNASLDGDEVLLHNSVNLGVAVALDGGLIVPVVKNAQDLTVVGLQKKVTDIANRARSKQLLPDEVQGGTFTITNPGQFGGIFGIPIISQPQVAILGLGGIQKRAVVIEGDAIAVRSMVYMCLSYDHRLVDGALAGQFMARVKHLLENWDASLD